jgi:hypothetical protein
MVTYPQILTTNFKFSKFYIFQILIDSLQWKSSYKIFAFKKIALSKEIY